MCGRFTLHHSTDSIIERFGVQEASFDLSPSFNIAPSQAVLAVKEENGFRFMEPLKWGLVPSWAKDPAMGNRMINARAETVAEKPSFRSALQRRRCIIPSDGFYEWKKVGSAKQPVHVRVRDGDLFGFAGLWEEWQSPDGSPLRTCTIITVAANKTLEPIHDRMPAILLPENEAIWLDTEFRDKEALRDLLRPYDDNEMDLYEVSPQVNSPGVNNESLICPLAV